MQPAHIIMDQDHELQYHTLHHLKRNVMISQGWVIWTVAIDAAASPTPLCSWLTPSLGILLLVHLFNMSKLDVT